MTVAWNEIEEYAQVTDLITPGDGYAYRARVEQDIYPDAPENCGGCPVIHMRHDYYGFVGAEMTGYGYGSAQDDGTGRDMGAVLTELTKRWGANAVPVLDRWLKIFHGGSAIQLSPSYYQGGDLFVTYDTRAMRESWGQTGQALETPAPDGEEWQAYLDGEVYVMSVERAEYSEEDDWNGFDWETVEGPRGGYYGQKYAEEVAQEELARVVGQAFAPGHGQEALPLAKPVVEVFRTADGAAWGIQVSTHSLTGPLRVFVNDSTVATGDPETGIRAGADTIPHKQEV